MSERNNSKKNKSGGTLDLMEEAIPTPQPASKSDTPVLVGEEDDPFAETVMAQMLADELTPIASPLRAAREEMSQEIPEEEESPMAVSAPEPQTPVSASPGLAIPRRYTQPGEDVWATVEWELRTASIVGSDGKVIFEQNGVEIPKSWSQLATNVVVSKYFRGHVGTLEREYSVKQLIGRVADRILEWGRDGSYFATDADAEAFHDELRFILLHQYAAFNSPVWFNLGWAGRRQAVSACLPYDVRVNTNYGLIPIGDIVRLFQSTPNAELFTYAPDGSPSRIINAVCNGRKRVVNFHLADGSTLRCTSNHRVFIRSAKGEIVEKEAGNLQIGIDRLVLSRASLLPDTTHLNLNLMTPDADLAWLAGLMVGDGYCGRSKTLTSDTWDLKLNTVPEKERVEAILAKYGVPFRTYVKSWGCCLRGHGAVSRSFWSALGLWGCVGDKQVPEWVFRASRENVCAFIGGLFDSDGHVSENGNRRLPVFSNTSLPLMQGTQILLRSLGIYGSLTAYTDAREDYIRKTSYTLGIHDNVSVDRFEALIGFTHAHKQARMAERQIESAASWRSADVLVVSKTLGGPEYVYDLQTESETFWAEGILLHNCYINEVDDTMEAILDLYKTEGMLFKDGSGSGVNLSALRSSKEPLEAGGKSSGPISFMKGLDASAGSIKSGGSTRRAACMRVLDVDHPDVKDFIECKQDAEKKAHALIDAGYSGAFNVPGGAYDTVPFQNANHSVRVSDAFMQAVESDSAWETKARLSGKTADTYRARDLMRSIAEGTWTCLPPGELILTESGERPIETLQAGDRVWTHKGRLARVNHAMVQAFAGDLIEISVNGYHRMLVTDNHPVLVAGYKGKSNFLPAEDVSVGDYLMVPNFRPRDGRRATRETQGTSILRLLGYYLAEGSVEDDRGTPATTRFTFHINETDYANEVLSLIRENFDKSASVRVLEARNVREVVVCSREIAATFMRLCGRGASGKRLNEDLFTSCDSAALLEMVDTWLRGDGHDRVLNGTHRQLTGRTVSERLARDMFRILVMNRLKPTMRRETPEGKQPVYSVSLFSRCAGRFYDRIPRGRGYLRYKVQSVRRIPYEGNVYNLNLDRDSTFLTNFFVVHNCGDPGMQYDTTINDWHTCANTDRIYASNPCCFVGQTLIETAGGQISFESLYARHEAGAVLPRVFSFDRGTRHPVLQTIRKVWVAGHTQNLVEVTTERGLTFRCTPEHRFLTEGGEYTEAQHLSPGTALRALRCASKDLPDAEELLETALQAASDTLRSVTVISLDKAVPVYDMEVAETHNFAISDANSAGLLSVVVSNSEFMFLNSTACNLSSLNLMKFRKDNATFDTESFEHAVQIMITAQEIVVGPASYPTPKITDRSHQYRPLGLGYANLGALLMAAGLPYDSDAGRAYAGAVTAIMTGRAYHQSALIARDCGGPFSGYAENRAPMLRIMKKHREAVDTIQKRHIPESLLAASRAAWDDALTEGEQFGYRNSQATVLAPTGCLVGDSLILTSRGLVRLQSLGNPEGKQWQPLDTEVATDEGPRQASRFYINGAEAVVTVETGRGYRIQGTPTHRIKVVDAQGAWQWRRFAEIRPGDRLPLMLGGLVGEANAVPLPLLPEAYWTSDHTTFAPRRMTPDLAEFVGYFMGDGSLHAKGIRLCVAKTDPDVVARLTALGRSLFGLQAAIAEKRGYTEVAFHSVRLTLWWEACGFAKRAPSETHSGKGYAAHLPDAVLHANDAQVYAAFTRGLFEADGTASNGYVAWTTISERFSRDMQSLLLTLGFVTTRKIDQPGRGKWGANPQYVLRLLNLSLAGRFCAEVGFLSARKRTLLQAQDCPQAARYDQIPLTRELVDMLAPANDALRKTLLMSLARTGTVSRRAATELLARAQHPKLGHLLGFFYDEVATAELGEEQMTYDLSVPDNVTYVANGFVSHNTIGFLMDCDTTGIEPDIAIVKYKSLVGGGMMKIVNQTVPEALTRLGYTEDQVGSIIGFIDEHDTIEGAPDLKPEHLPIFDCAFRPMNGTRSIHHMGHVKMMAAAQPFISGAISKTVNVAQDATPEDIAETYLEAWKLGLKAIAIYRDGSKRTQPLNTSREAPAVADKSGVATADALPPTAVRHRLPDERASVTHKFSIGGHEGYLTVGLYPDTNQPGEIFIRMAKEGSSISGLMDSFATAISLALQYGVPLSTLVDKFIHSRFEPSGFTGNKEIPMAKSVMDYIFRYLALRFLQKEERHNVGLIADQEADKKAAETPAPAPEPGGLFDHDNKNGSLSNGNGHKSGSASAPPAQGSTASITEHEREIFRMQSDAPPCPECGALTVRSGACYKCLSCGTSLGCS